MGKVFHKSLHAPMATLHTSKLRNYSLVLLSFVRIGTCCLCGVLLTACVGASNWLTGSTEIQNSSFDESHYFAPMRIGATPVQEITSRFGVPDDVQFGSIDERQIQSLSYSSNELVITPFQYIPLFGAFEMWRQALRLTPSAAISFSPEERVSGLTVSSKNAYSDVRFPGSFTREGDSISFYGLSNPTVFHAANTSSAFLP